MELLSLDNDLDFQYMLTKQIYTVPLLHCLIIFHAECVYRITIMGGIYCVVTLQLVD